jgi:hypothetical protein
MSETLTSSTTPLPEIIPEQYPNIALDSEADQPELYNEAEDDAEWWAEELKRLDKYINHEAKYRVGRRFMIGNEMFLVWFSKPDGSNGNYTTPFIDMQNLSTGEMTYEITPEEVDAMIASAETDDASSPELAETKELQSLQEIDPGVVEYFDVQQTDDSDLQKEAIMAINAFNELVSRHPVYEAERREFMITLQNYLEELQSSKRSDYDIAG